MLGKVLFASAALFSISSAASAMPLQHTYNFGCPIASCPYEVVKNFDPAGPDLVPGLQVTAKTVNASGSTVNSVTPGSGVGIGQWPTNGLGEMSTSGDNSHTVDGSGLNDLLQLAFDTEVKILSATFTYAGVISNSNDAFAFFADDDGNGSVAGDMVFSHEDIGAVGGVGTYNFTANLLNLDDIFSKTFAFAAIWDENRSVCIRWRYGKCKEYKTVNFFDSFKLQSVTVEERPKEVPLPAALPMLLSALGIGGLVARRRARKAA